MKNNITKKLFYICTIFLTMTILRYLPMVLFEGGAYLIFDKYRLSYQNADKYMMYLEIIISLILLIVFYLAYKFIFSKKRERFNSIKLNRKDALKSVIIGIGFTGVSYIWILIVENLLKAIPSISTALTDMSQANSEAASGGMLTLFLLAVVFAPLIEEFVFRGLIYNSFEKLKTGFLPIVLSALIFGIYHMNLIQIVYTTMMGIIAAYVYSKTNNIIYPIIIHFINNFIAFLTDLIKIESAEMIINTIGLIMICPMLYIMYSYYKESKILVNREQTKN